MTNAAWLRVIQHLIRAELRITHPQLYQRVELADILPELPLKDGPLAIDSLTLVGLATACATLLNLFENGNEDTLLGQRTPAQWAAIVGQANPSKLAFKTSGTSGTPKIIEHSLAMLRDEAKFWASLLPDNIERIVAICPAHHIYGFIWTTLIQEALQNRLGKLIEVLDVGFENLASSTFKTNDLIVSVPTIWDFIATSKMALPKDVTLVSSTAPLSVNTAATLRDRQQVLAMFEIYGSSETSAVGFRYAAGPYELIPQLQRSATEENFVVRQGEDGEFRRLSLQDHLQWDADRKFTPTKRVDDVVQLGGHNVSPQWVKEQIAQSPEIKECAVRTFDQNGKVALKIYLVLQNDSEDNRHQLIWNLRQRLAAHAMPRSFAFGTSLPKTETGKLADWPLPA
jgi:long-chain acyl-CoA synthetase